eukprot:CAMPEP_0183564330 /NCGR_PEP_ID=MMETSP0371-20130417/105174_1 /TAXON_ID=268820 /ORGANISM="Peridinium aciculiferum, Strain PAER-2" /LENGTH=154 /DNA_ID=CAMNT_0025773345 /DNA_START=70 /DNA_END=530 /DNA_ORIENTATION=-
MPRFLKRASRPHLQRSPVKASAVWGLAGSASSRRTHLLLEGHGRTRRLTPAGEGRGLGRQLKPAQQITCLPEEAISPSCRLRLQSSSSPWFSARSWRSSRPRRIAWYSSRQLCEEGILPRTDSIYFGALGVASHVVGADLDLVLVDIALSLAVA